MLLELDGYTVNIYDSARSFLAAIQNADTGCILTDVQLPEMNGLDLLEALNVRGIFLPTIVMSGLPDAEFEITARNRGAVDFFETPMDPEILLAAIRKASTRFR
jgi:two-component system response regulator FixJ